MPIAGAADTVVLPMALFHLIRHGAHDLLGQTVTSRTPGVSLNQLGLAQARGVAAALRDHRIGAIIATPLERTQEMAAPLAESLGRPIRIENDFIDIDFGPWTMVPFAALYRDPAWQAFNAFRSGIAIPGGESMSAVQARAVSPVLRLRDEFAESEVAVFSHGDVIRSILMYFLGMPLDFVHRLEVSPGSRSMLALKCSAARLLAFNLPAID